MKFPRIPLPPLLGSLLLLAACATGPQIDTRYVSRSQDSRVLFIVLHYTANDFQTSLGKLTAGQVSAHYLVSDSRDGKPVRTYRLVDETMRAWHAGLSEWLGHVQLNAASIGIELVNDGWADTPQGRVYEPYPPEQIEAVVALVKDISRRHRIKPERIVGHSDVQPHMKLDPGPLFPWKRLADEGLIVWPDAARVADGRARFAGNIPPVAWFQERLAVHGFGSNVPRSGQLDESTCNVLSAFQMKYRPRLYDGTPDEETAALLSALTEGSP